MRRRQKAWVFVSHSTKDMASVRRVRNEIEGAGGEPLLFFLKCISESDELDDLLKREIVARRYFLLCDSTHAQASKWVQDEVAHVRSLTGKRIETIDLTWAWARQAAVVKTLLKTATLFPVYARPDRRIVEPLLEELERLDFGLFDAFDREGPVDELADEITIAIDQSRYLLEFVSRHSLASQWCRLETDYFVERTEQRGNYIPVLLERGLFLDASHPARNVVAIDFADRNVETFVAALERRLYGDA